VPHLVFTGKAGERMMVLLESSGIEIPDGMGTSFQDYAASVPEPEVPEPVEGPFLFYYATMEEAFAYIAAHAKAGDVCLLSPAASSYDQYKNFEERGRKFKLLAEAFGK